MNDLAQEWIDKAEGDFHTAAREARARKHPNYDAVCFHCQQCAEKYLKAYLQSHAISIPRIHNLVGLLELCLPVDGTLELLRDVLDELSKYAVEFRYPGESAIKADAQQALSALKTVRAFMRQKLVAT